MGERLADYVRGSKRAMELIKRYPHSGNGLMGDYYNGLHNALFNDKK